MKTPMLAHSKKRAGFGSRWGDAWPSDPTLWMIAGFLVGLVLAAITLAVFGAADQGIGLSLRITARWSFLLFWLAYTGGALARLFGPRFEGLARRGRELGLAFASAQLVHLGLILWLYHIATEPSGAMVFFWVGMLCTYLLALFSVQRLRDALKPLLWRMLRTIAVEYIALVFAVDFIIEPLQLTHGKYPLSYIPFALMLVGGVSLRIAAFARRRANFLARFVPQWHGTRRS